MTGSSNIDTLAFVKSQGGGFNFRAVLIFPLLGIYLALMVLFVRMYNADVADNISEDLFTTDSEGSLQLSKEALRLNPYEPSYYLQHAKALIIAGYTRGISAQISTKRNAFADLEKAVQLNPKNLATLRNSIPIYFFLASADLSRAASVDNIDQEYIGKVRDFYAYVSTINPNDAGTFVTLQKYQKRLNFEDQYKESVNRIKFLRPELLNWAL